MKKLNLILMLVLVSGITFGQTTWNIDKSHTNIMFTVTHMVIAEVTGNFKEFEGKVVTASEDFNGADVEFMAKSASIFTDSEGRDKDLRSENFFATDLFPEVKFAGKIVKDGAKYRLKGQFTMRDVTKDVDFDLTYRGSVNTGRGMKAGFKINGAINRFDYGLKWDRALEAGSLVVANEVLITCNVELNMAK